ncbi:hypothetical protein [Butyrivibrio sp. CB08]|nr:hypothetical protein [Butyrivibrio sp. CB08]
MPRKSVDKRWNQEPYYRGWHFKCQPLDYHLAAEIGASKSCW